MLGIITLGLKPEGEYLAKFLEDLERVSNRDLSVFDYRSLDPTPNVESGVDSLVLSSGDAPVGLDTEDRFKRDPNIRALYAFIRTSVGDGVPLLGINAGHLALNCAYDWAISGVPEGYKGEHQISITNTDDPFIGGIDALTMNLTNGFAVLPLKDQAHRPLQENIAPFVDFMGHPLISRVSSESGAPVYGVQFNIQPGTERVFRNFFQLASQYLKSK